MKKKKKKLTTPGFATEGFARLCQLVRILNNNNNNKNLIERYPPGSATDGGVRLSQLDRVLNFF